QYSMRVDVDVESFSVNGRNDLIYPRFKNAHWQFSNIDSIFFSVKFTSQQLIEGTNPIVRLCKNGNNRIEFIPTHDGLYCDFFKDDALRDSDGWYTFRIPLSGNDSWERNLIGYIDPALSPSDRELAKQQLYENILEDVNYFEISIQLAGSEYWSRGESVVYYIDDLRIHAKDIPVAVELANTREEQNAKNQDEKIFVSVFPVPAEAELHVNIDNKAANEIHVTVINAQGQSVYIGSYSAQMLQPHSISTLGFQTGVYFVQILGNNGALKVVKIIKK
ncbi:MAG: T9SS type A sorting domain-containing protein, partial [Cyclobacteriaceae bacterium]|nr:T9SS type A sorting domain-containing protein [Cyclobacteriaceae bacterium]